MLPTCLAYVPYMFTKYLTGIRSREKNFIILAGSEPDLNRSRPKVANCKQNWLLKSLFFPFVQPTCFTTGNICEFLRGYTWIYWSHSENIFTNVKSVLPSVIKTNYTESVFMLKRLKSFGLIWYMGIMILLRDWDFAGKAAWRSCFMLKHNFHEISRVSDRFYKISFLYTFLRFLRLNL